MNSFLMTFGSFVILAVVWWIAGFFINNPDQFAYITRLGKFIGVKASGLRHRLWPIDRATKLPLSGQQVPFARIGVVAREAEYLGKARGEAIIGIDVVMNFQFHNDSTIQKTIEYLGDPPDINKLVDNLEEPVQSALRAEGNILCWLQIFIERDEVSKKALEKLLNNESSPLSLAHLKYVSFSIKHIEVEKKLLGSINEPEVQRLLMEASKSEAERERILRAGKGRGDAEARKAIFEIANKYPELEQLLTLREMAQGQATTIFVPRELLNALESYTGKPMGSNEEIVKLLEQIIGKFPA